MKYDNKKVSVIIPVYNAEKYIENTINSVVKQNYDDYEVILVDDCSKDNSADIIKRIQNDNSRIVYIRQDRNHGAAVARNTAITKAKGRYIAFLDVDDEWCEGKLQKQLAFMSSKNAAISCTALDTMDENGKLLSSVRNVKEKIDYNFLLHNTMIATSTVIVDRNLTGDFLMPLRRGGQDYATWLMLMRNGIVCYGLNEILSHYRISSNSLSSNKLKSIRQVWVIQTQNEKINPIKAIFNVSGFIINAFIKHFIS